MNGKCGCNCDVKLGKEVCDCDDEVGDEVVEGLSGDESDMEG